MIRNESSEGCAQRVVSTLVVVDGVLHVPRFKVSTWQFACHKDEIRFVLFAQI